jgi:hypothetical protein
MHGRRRSRNNLLLAGGLAAVAGLFLIYNSHRLAGALLLSIGVAAVVIAYKVSSLLFMLDMSSERRRRK